jgi:TolA-binding protein
MNSFRLILNEPSETGRELEAEATLRFAEAALSNGSFQDAIDSLSGFEQRFPNDPRLGEAAFRLGEALEAGSRDAAAVDAFLRASSISDAPAQVRSRAAFRAGLLQLKMRRLDEVHETLEKVAALGAEPELVQQALLVRSRAYELAEDWLDSLNLLEKLFQDGSISPAFEQQARFRRAWALQMLGRVDESRREFTDLVEDAASGTFTFQALFWLGQDCFGRGDFAAARRWFERLGQQAAASSEPLAGEGLYWAARSAQREQLWRESISLFQQVVDLGQPVDRAGDARFGQGESATEMGDFTLAADFFKDLIQRWPDHEMVASAWGRMGDCFWTLKNMNRAPRGGQRISFGPIPLQAGQGAGSSGADPGGPRSLYARRF